MHMKQLVLILACTFTEKLVLFFSDFMTSFLSLSLSLTPLYSQTQHATVRTLVCK